jgi:hypothetical protein
MIVCPVVAALLEPSKVESVALLGSGAIDAAYAQTRKESEKAS